MNQNQIMQMLNQFRQNPMQFLVQRGVNVPPEIQNNPQAIIQHLMNSGVISQAQYNQAAQMAKNLRF